MRIAVLILGIVLSIASFFQSLAVSTLSSVSSDLSDTAAEKAAADSNAGGGGIGVIASLVMLVAAGLAIAKPKASAITFGCAVPLWLLAAAGTDFSDAYIWAAVSAILAVMSWAGIKERAKAEQKKQEAFQANVVAAAQAMQTQGATGASTESPLDAVPASPPTN